MTKFIIIDSAVETMKILHYAGNDMESIGAEALALFFFLPKDEEMNPIAWLLNRRPDSDRLQEDAGSLNEIRGA